MRGKVVGGGEGVDHTYPRLLQNAFWTLIFDFSNKLKCTGKIYPGLWQNPISLFSNHVLKLTCVYSNMPFWVFKYILNCICTRTLTEIYTSLYFILIFTYVFQTYVLTNVYICIRNCIIWDGMGWLQLVGSIKLQVSFAKETYKRDNILQKRPIFYRSYWQ